eukprot:scaffold129_cov79-Cylindrotheca_fusiformis.AAC.2
MDEGELLMKIPPDAYLKVKRDDDDDSDDDDYTFHDDVCALKELLWNEIQLGKESKFAPYVTYIQSLELHHLPGLWSEMGKQLLEEMLYDPDIDEDNVLPPEGATSFWGADDCLDPTDNDDDDVLAMAIATSRGWDKFLTPIYDLLRHDNENVNTETTSFHGSGGFQVFTTTSIRKNDDELFLSFDRCLDCGDDPEMIGTPEIFRDLGIIENYPQRFHFGGIGLTPLFSVDIIKESDDDNDDSIENLSAVWIFDQIPIFGSYFGGPRFLKEHLERLEQYKTTTLAQAAASNVKSGLLPQSELDAILKYHDVLTKAMTLAIQLAEQEYWEPEIDYSYYSLEDFDDDDDDDDNTTSSSKYILPEETAVVDHLDDFRRVLYQAETLVYATEHYEGVQSFKSQYQLIEHYRDPQTGDMCFNLDTIFQMCHSYWPYYHEVQVHKAAKYLSEDIKRVLFVGAGDNGLLNEIVKYHPSLELVVGLELDQHVARLAFKHFGAPTHYHNEKVQWWYGDASKTLFMLPTDYFGSFDLVLVDLSDTIFALTVSNELDVVGALSLLLRPGGIFAMNELFFKKVSDVFEYALYYQFYNIPKLGDQGFVFASNDVSLLNQELTDHKVENVLVEDSLLKTDHQFRFVHDYRHNPSSTFHKLCKNPDDEATADTESHHQESNSPGIFMALEAEELTSKQLASPSKVKKAIEKALKKQGMHVISSTNNKIAESSFVTVFQEGYLTVHLNADKKYCGFDILLWSSFEKFEAVKTAVVKSVGGDTSNTSSFRIVTGGMFGVSTWREDAKSHGPQITKKCSSNSNQNDGPVRASASPDSVMEIALEGSLGLVQRNESYVVAILCGTENEPCKSIPVLEQQSDKVSAVIPLYACSISSSTNKKQNSIEEIQHCSTSAASEKLETEIGQKKKKETEKIQMVVVDPAATIAMEDIVDMMSDNLYLEQNVYAVAMIDSKTELWKRSVVDRIRTRITRLDPVFRAHVLLNTTESSLELAVASSGDEYFIEHLKSVVSSMEERAADGEVLSLEIRNIFGGSWKAEPTYIVKDDAGLKFFTPEDFQHRKNSSLEQYKTQRPIGIQSISQYTNVVRGRQKKLTVEEINDGFLKVLSSSDLMGSSKDPFTATFDSVGDGIVQLAIWENDGMIIFVWDGRVQLDVNIYCGNDNAKLDVLNDIQTAVEQAMPNLRIKLRDFHPRGYGRVVNFVEDLKDLPEPYWA